MSYKDSIQLTIKNNSNKRLKSAILQGENPEDDGIDTKDISTWDLSGATFNEDKIALVYTVENERKVFERQLSNDEKNLESYLKILNSSNLADFSLEGSEISAINFKITNVKDAIFYEGDYPTFRRTNITFNFPDLNNYNNDVLITGGGFRTYNDIQIQDRFAIVDSKNGDLKPSVNDNNIQYFQVIGSSESNDVVYLKNSDQIYKLENDVIANIGNTGSSSANVLIFHHENQKLYHISTLSSGVVVDGIGYGRLAVQSDLNDASNSMSEIIGLTSEKVNQLVFSETHGFAISNNDGNPSSSDPTNVVKFEITNDTITNPSLFDPFKFSKFFINSSGLLIGFNGGNFVDPISGLNSYVMVRDQDGQIVTTNVSELNQVFRSDFTSYTEVSKMNGKIYLYGLEDFEIINEGQNIDTFSVVFDENLNFLPNHKFNTGEAFQDVTKCRRMLAVSDGIIAVDSTTLLKFDNDGNGLYY